MAQKPTVNKRLTPKALKKFVRPDKPLSIALLEAMREKLDDAIDMGDFDDTKAHPINGHEMPYQQWLKVFAPHAASSEMERTTLVRGNGQRVFKMELLLQP